MHQSKIFQSTPIDHHAIPQSRLNIENKTRSNPLKWRGQFSPQLVDVLLDTYAQDDFLVFDPFLGSGTVLLSASQRGNAAAGTDVNPAAYFLSKTYSFVNYSERKRSETLQSVTQLLDNSFEIKLLNTHHKREDATYVKQQMQQALSSISSEEQDILVRALVVLLDLHKKGLNEKRVFDVWNRLRQHIIELPFTDKPISMFLSDARSTPLETCSVDLVITSPPYINVFNYHQQYRTSLEYMNFNLLTAAKSEIGANRKHRGNRFLTAIQYCLDIAMVFLELLRLCHSSSRMIFVVGRESTIRGTKFYNGEIVAEIAHNVLGLELEQRQERNFKNRFGKNIYEDILHFSCHGLDMSEATLILKAQQVAGAILESVAKAQTTDDAARDDIAAALNKLDEVYPSPLLSDDTVKDVV